MVILWWLAIQTFDRTQGNFTVGHRNLGQCISLCEMATYTVILVMSSGLCVDSKGIWVGWTGTSNLPSEHNCACAIMDGHPVRVIRRCLVFPGIGSRPPVLDKQFRIIDRCINEWKLSGFVWDFIQQFCIKQILIDTERWCLLNAVSPPNGADPETVK